MSMPAAPLLAIAVVGVALGCAGCVTKDPATRTEKTSNMVEQGVFGMVKGFGLGALSAVANGQNVAETAIKGGVVYGINGALAGAAMDQFEAGLLREFEAAGVKVAVRGQNVVLEIGDGITFENGNTVPRGPAARKLAAVGKILARYRRHRVDLIGHTSPEEPPALSEQRASVVKGILVRNGIAPGRIGSVGRGATEPLRQNTSEVTRAINRRVDILLAPVT